MKKKHPKFVLLTLILVLIFSALPVNAQGGEFTLTVLHNNDGESQLLNAGGEIIDFGGVARFATLVENLRAEAISGAGNEGVILLSSGDNFLAGPEFTASQEKGVPFYDTIAIDSIGYDAMAIGNHEFDFGPELLADFIEGFDGRLPFVSANLDFSGEARLQALVDQGDIVKSLVVDEAGEQIGVVGATTPQIPYISSPRNVRVGPDVAGAIQAEIDALQGNGVNKIIVISHLQDVQEDLDLATQLSGVDIMIAGGGDELLANEGDVLVPGDEEPFGPYPLLATGADGAEIPVVTTAGDYKYVGRLIVTFDAEGNVTAVDENSSLARVAGGDNPDAVAPDPEIQAQVVDPVSNFVSDLANNVIATSEVALEGRREPGVRTMETNEGNLLADALLWQATQLADEFGVSAPQVAMQNGGGIRNNNLIPAGDFTELNTFDIAPFANYVAVVENIPPEQFKELMENGVAEVETAGGRFTQIAGFSIVYDLAGTPQALDESGGVSTPGTRVQEIHLDDGTAIVENGAVVSGAPAVNVATIDFLARGGDQYPFRDASFTPLGVSYQQALSDYIVEVLGGVITAAQYPESGSGRIAQIGAAAPSDAPATLPQSGAPLSALPYLLLSLAGAGLTGAGLWLRRKQ
jgi:5'-nucleotidase